MTYLTKDVIKLFFFKSHPSAMKNIKRFVWSVEEGWWRKRERYRLQLKLKEIEWIQVKTLSAVSSETPKIFTDGTSYCAIK